MSNLRKLELLAAVAAGLSICSETSRIPSFDGGYSYKPKSSTKRSSVNAKVRRAKRKTAKKAKARSRK